jgi:hypothetical protein
MEAMAASAPSARLKARTCEIECRVQLRWRCESNRFKLDTGVKLIRIVTVGQHLSNVLQRRCVCGINERSKIGIGLTPGLSPDPRRREQSRSVVNEIVRGVHNEVVRRVRRRGQDARPDLLLRLLLQLTESAHAQQCSIPDFFSDYQALAIKSPVMPSPA